MNYIEQSLFSILNSLKSQVSALRAEINSSTSTTGKLSASSNLSDLTNIATARTNLGLGTLATQNGTFSGTNTGDETATTIKTKLGITTLSGSNTGDQNLSGYLLSSTASTTYFPLTGTLGVTNGGNGLITATLGDLRYGSGVNTLAALAGNTTATQKFLTQTGNGSVSAAPVWTDLFGGSNVFTNTKNTFSGTFTATAQYGVLNVGNAPFDGATTGFFSGSSSGTIIAVNASSAFSGRLLDAQSNGTTQFFVTSTGNLFTNGRVGIKQSTMVGLLHISNGNSVSSTYSTTGFGLVIDAQTFTSTTSSGTISLTGAHTIGTPTLAASSATTLTNAATLYINAAPTAGTNVTITNQYAFYAAAGLIGGAGGINTGSGSGSNFGTATGSAAAAAGTTSTTMQAGGATTTLNRVFMNGSGASTVTANASYTNLMVGSAPVAINSSGTHPVFANAVVNPVGTITGTGATLTETTTLLVNGATTGGTNNYALHVSGSSANSIVDGLVGIATTLPTHSLTIGSTGTGISIYNTSDQTTNYERFRMFFSTNVATFSSENGGTGTGRDLKFISPTLIAFQQGGTVKMNIQGTSLTGFVAIGSATSGGNQSGLGVTTTLTASSSNANAVSILSTATQTVTGGYRGLWISIFENTLGSGSHYLIDAGTNSASLGSGTHTSKFTVDNSGNVVIVGNTTLSKVINLQTYTNASPANGDFWFDGTNLKFQVGGVTKTVTIS